jgi:rare lipoprotein A
LIQARCAAPHYNKYLITIGFHRMIRPLRRRCPRGRSAASIVVGTGLCQKRTWMGGYIMRRWLIILSLAVVQCPDLATAATRTAEVPLWKRLLSVLIPNTAPAARPAYRELVHRELVHHEPSHHEHPRSAKTTAPSDVPVQTTAAPVTASLAPAPMTAAPLAAAPQIAAPAVVAAPAAVAAPAIAAAPPAAAPKLAAPLVIVAPATAAPAPASPAPAPLEPEFRVAALPEPADALPPPPIVARDRRTRSSGCNGGQRVVSAYYWEGRHTASGQPFNPHGMTAAHRTLPFGTHLTVTNPRNGQSVVVVINDRGPFVSGVTLDLSIGAAQAIGLHGTGAVCIS